MPVPPAQVHRRSVVTGVGAGLGLVALVATGCDDASSSPADGATRPPADADSALVARVVKALRSAAALATASGSAVPGLKDAGDRLARLHQRHARELGATTAPPRRSVRGDRATVLRRLTRTEERLQQRLTQAALDAESGALAQLLASMAAAVAQQRVDLT